MNWFRQFILQHYSRFLCMLLRQLLGIDYLIISEKAGTRIITPKPVIEEEKKELGGE